MLSANTTGLQPLPDWSDPEGVVLALPAKGFAGANRRKIILDYAEYLAQHDVPVTILTHDDERVSISGVDPSLLSYRLCPVGDIWIRDWAPLQCRLGDTVLAVKFVYPDTYPYDAQVDNLAGKTMSKVFALPMIESDIVWELGNYTTNGRDIIVTDQILRANGFADGDVLQKQLVEKLGFDPAIRIHVLPLNDCYEKLCLLLDMSAEFSICHIDGIMRFIGAQTIVYHHPYVGNLIRQAYSKQNDLFPNDWSAAQRKSYLDTISAIRDIITGFVSQHQSSFEFIPIYSNHDYPVASQKSCEASVCSDEMDYINFLRYGQARLFLPFFAAGRDHRDNEKALNQLQKRSGLLITSVSHSFVDMLAMAGGVLNCASWVKYK